MTRLSIVPGLLLLSLALYGQPDLATDSLLVDGIYRTFHFTKPDAPRKNGSLIFVLHGSGGDGRQMARATSALEKRSATDNFIAVYPDAHKRFWNECRKGSNAEANLRDIDEVAFFNAMIDYFNKMYGIDDSRVFAVGTSGGGHMAYKLAMLNPSRIRAVTAIIANLPAGENMDCTPLHVPVPIMIVNGTEDTVNPYAGGQVRAGAFNPGAVRSTEESFRYWARLAGYDGDPRKETLPDRDPKDGKTIERYTYHKKNRPEVVLLKVIGGKHDYPNDIDVHVEAWQFFKRQ